jgi:hypothetical protein
MTIDEWDRASALGRRWAYFGSMVDGARVDSPVVRVVRVVRWSAAGVRVRFPDGHQETVHPGYLHLAAAA